MPCTTLSAPGKLKKPGDFTGCGARHKYNTTAVSNIENMPVGTLSNSLIIKM